MSEETQIEELKLTTKQVMFCEYYVGIANLNATRAALLAGYSQKTARQIGSENLSKLDISAYIEKRLDELALTSKEVLTVLTNHAKGSIADVLDENGEFDYVSMVERGADKLLKKLKIKKTIRRDTKNDEEVEEITHEFELHDAQSAAVHVGKAHGLFTENINHGGAIATYPLSKEEWEQQAAKRLKEANKQLEKFNE